MTPSEVRTAPTLDLGLLPTDFPADFFAADQAAVHAQRRHKSLLRADLLLLVTAALVSAMGSTVDPTSDWSRAWHLSALVFLITAVFLKIANRHLRYDALWFDGRAVAESVRTLAWRYMMQARPFDTDEPQVRAEFTRRLRDIVNEHSAFEAELHRLPANQQQITPTMRHVRALAFEERRALYSQHRASDQADWYRRKAAQTRTTSNHWFWVSLAAEFLAISIAVVQLLTDMVDLIGVAATIAAAVTAWNEAERNAELAKTYGRTAHELSLLDDRIQEVSDDVAFAAVVTEVEDVLASEHAMWVAKRT
jgi:hypothetical protein